MTSRLLIALLTVMLSAAPTWACGVFLPTVAEQLAIEGERILFAPEGDQMHMFARLTWAGEPADFGWLLPVPRDAELRVSSEALFQWLEARYGARFRVQDAYDESCDGWFSAFDGGVGNGGADAGVDGRSGVQVLAQQAVGPFEQVLLAAESADELVTWLDTHGYVAPDGIAERLQPYLDLGLGVMALRLSAGARLCRADRGKPVRGPRSARRGYVDRWVFGDSRRLRHLADGQAARTPIAASPMKALRVSPG